MKKIITLALIALSLSKTIKAQNVGINASGAAPAASAMLDVDVSTLGATAKKGFLMPRIALLSITDVVTIPSPANSLMVFNTTAASSGTSAVYPGYYYYDGTVWVAFSGTGSKGWALLGNAGTVAGTNFLGTTDNIDLVFKVNNVQAGRITSATNNNIFLGFESGLNNTTSFNAFFGSQAGKANTSGGNNVGLGFGAMRNNTTGGVNTFVGNNAGANWLTSLANTAIGNQALQGLGASTGSCNTAIGFAAGSGYTGTPPGGSANGLSQLSGSYNTYIGYSSSSTISSNTFTNSTAIGAFSQAGANDVLILGSINGANTASATTNVGIGITTPTAALHVVETAASINGVQINESNTGNGLLIVENDGGSGIFVTENGNGSGVAILSNDDGGGFTLTQQGVVTTSNTAAYIENRSSTVTNNLLRKGLDVVSNTAWAAGTATNIGLSVDVIGAGSATNLAATFMGGNVGIGTMTPVATLDVAGTTKIGTLGSVISNIVKTNVSLNIPAILATATAPVIITVTDAQVNGTVMANPRVALPLGLTYYCRVTAANQVTITFVATVALVATPGVIFDVTVIN